MSRTIRRKGAYSLKSYVGLPEEIDSYDLDRYDAKSAEECILKKKAWFHSDKHSGQWGVPSWFCRLRNRRISRANHDEIRRCMVRNEWDDHLPIGYIKDAGYIWW